MLPIFNVYRHFVGGMIEKTLIFFENGKVVAFDLEVEVFVDGHFWSHRLENQKHFMTMIALVQPFEGVGSQKARVFSFNIPPDTVARINHSLHGLQVIVSVAP